MRPELQNWVLEEQHLPHHNLLLVTTLLASLSNSFLLYRFYVNRLHLKPAHMSLVSISLSDFVSASGVFSGFALHSANRELAWYWCQFSGVFCCITGASALSFWVMGVERYSHIVLQKSFKQAHILFLLALCWIFSLFLAFFPIIYKTYHVPQPAPVYCFPDFAGRTPLHFVVSIASIIAIISVIGINCVSYYLIYRNAVIDGFTWGTLLYNPPLELSLDSESRQNAGSSQQKAVMTEAVGRKAKDSAQRKQIIFTIKLAAITMSFVLVTWLGTCVSFTYQTI
ncbi:hypothetical protein BKA69DRAFT_1098154 [Paraphysoderma sedebokerense]|nr:hypothetical protein BKA69DRAFT_1098154 [Paraphysoderma sedebokerense]